MSLSNSSVNNQNAVSTVNNDPQALIIPEKKLPFTSLIDDIVAMIFQFGVENNRTAFGNKSIFFVCKKFHALRPRLLAERQAAFDHAITKICQNDWNTTQKLIQQPYKRSFFTAITDGIQALSQSMRSSMRKPLLPANPIVQLIPKYNGSIKMLHLSNIIIGNSMANIIVIEFPQLKELKLSEIKLENHDTLGIFGALLFLEQVTIQMYTNSGVGGIGSAKEPYVDLNPYAFRNQNSHISVQAPSLKQLTIRDTAINPSSTEFFLQSKIIEEISIIRCSYEDINSGAVFNAILSPFLHTINFVDCPFLTDKELALILRQPKLEVLSIGMAAVALQHVVTVDFNLLVNVEHFRVLNYLSDLNMHIVGLGLLVNLKKLTWKGHLGSIFRDIPKLQALQELCFQCAHFSTPTGHDNLNSIESLSKLCSLTFRGCIGVTQEYQRSFQDKIPRLRVTCV